MSIVTRFMLFIFLNKKLYLCSNVNNVAPATRCPAPGPISNAFFNVTTRIYDVDESGQYFGGTHVEWICDPGWTMTPDNFYGQNCTNLGEKERRWRSLYRDEVRGKSYDRVKRGKCVRGKNFQAILCCSTSTFDLLKLLKLLILNIKFNNHSTNT